MPLISVIIPVYNGEQFLSRCIDSILVQTLTDFELILINDGSVDNSLHICDNYVLKDSRIKVLSQNNAGVSVARNNGIKESIGQYITFVDCDDWLDADCLSSLYNNMMSKCVDLSMMGYKETGTNCQIEKDTSVILFEKILTRDEMMFHLFEPVDFMSFCYPWGKLYKASIIKYNHIEFNPMIIIGEDRLFIFTYLRYTDAVFCTSKSFYYYCINPNGAMNLVNLPIVSIKYLSNFEALNIMRKFLSDNKKYDILDVLNKDYVYSLIRIFMKVNEKDSKSLIRIIKNYSNYYMWRPFVIPLKLWSKMILVLRLGWG